MDATEHIRSAGARVIASKPGLALIETTDEIAGKIGEKLKDWRISSEKKAALNPPRPKMPGKTIK